MPHRHVTFEPWVNDIAEQDPCLGRAVKEAVVAQDAALGAGATKKSASKDCRKKFEAAEHTLDSIRLGRVRPNTDAAWKRAADALRKFTEALDCTAAPRRGFSGIRTRIRARS